MVKIAKRGARNSGAICRKAGANPRIPGAIVISVPKRLEGTHQTASLCSKGTAATQNCRAIVQIDN